MNKSTAIYHNRINQVIDYVNSRLNQSFSIEELAAVANFNKRAAFSSLTRLVKALTVSPVMAIKIR